jgi:siroheme synthase-like protein
VDDPELCSFIVQAVVRRGDLTVSIGTGGKSPALAKRVREVIEKTVGPEYTDLTELMGEMRRLAMEQIPGQPEREKALKQILDSEIIDLLKNGRHREARVLAVHILSHQHPTSNAQYPSCI